MRDSLKDIFTLKKESDTVWKSHPIVLLHSYTAPSVFLHYNQILLQVLEISGQGHQRSPLELFVTVRHDKNDWLMPWTTSGCYYISSACLGGLQWRIPVPNPQS